MAFSRDVRFFDRTGMDMNLGPVFSENTSLYDGSTSSSESFEGRIFFPKVSIGLIESQQVFFLQEVTGPTSSYQLRRVQGTAQVVAGNPTVAGIDSDFSVLQVGNDVKIGENVYSVISLGGTGSFIVSPTPSVSDTTSDIYFFDYLSYNALRSSPNTSYEKLRISLPDSQSEFFLYGVNYTEDYPVIEKSYSMEIDLADGSSDVVDPLTGRISLSTINTVASQVNLGFSSGTTAQIEGIYETNLSVVLEKVYYETLMSAPTGASSTFFVIGGTSHDLFESTEFYLQGVTAPGATVTFFETDLKVISVGITGASGEDTYIEVETENFPTISISTYTSFQVLWVNTVSLATLNLYGETEDEDMRFKLVLENFGKKINSSDEYIFRESDIDEPLTNFTILNRKRKELLLEGDNIYPYLGSYRALVNIINFFGYYDLRIKEYFLNVEANSSNFGKFMHVLIPKSLAQRDQIKNVWANLPSKIYKKTSLFGLFYDLNTTTENEDIYGIPEVVDAFDYSPEEVLIKLFGLKELLKKQFLPLNARIYDITGEGIYFERIRIDSWADNLNHLVVDLGTRPQFKILPENFTYVSDIRRIDDYYIRKFSEQGLTGFVGYTASDPAITASTGSSGPISDLYGTYLESYDYYREAGYGTIVDETQLYFPPGISNPDFNFSAAVLTPLPDEEKILAAGPALLETFFDISWQDSVFTWQQLSIMGPSGSPLNINYWSWESLGRGEAIEMKWIVQKHGENGFYYDSGRKAIQEFLVLTEGEKDFSIRASIVVEMGFPYGPTGPMEVVSASVINPGYGYLTAPTVSVASPGGTGTEATISCTIDANGYVVGATVTGAGSGYTFVPFVNVEAPSPIYNVDYRYLHAVALPYEGIYDVALYVYDITNNFSVDFQKYEVRNWNVDFVSISRSETPERTWKQFEVPLEPPVPGTPLELVTWEDVTGPWYYPLHVESKWEDAETAWESLNYSSYEGTSLFEYEMNTRILEISRSSNYVILEGDLTGNLQNLNVLNVGDYLFFTREESDIIASNVQVLVDEFGSKLIGLSGGLPYDAVVSGASGATSISTSDYDTSSYLSSGDQVWLSGSWYEVEAVGATYISITSPLLIDVVSTMSVVYPANGQVKIGYTGPERPMAIYSRIIATTDSNYLTIDIDTDYYSYINGLTATGNYMTVVGEEYDLKNLILQNSSLGSTSSLYLSWGIFAGTYAIEITNIGLSGDNTMFRLNDPDKELYYLDGNFKVRLADYDVDYAENRIGAGSLTYANANEVTWNENEALSWYGLEYHGGSLCGFIIPFVQPGGSITVDENDSFFFSGDSAINSTKAGLILASRELNASLNAGILKYNYSVLPEDELYVANSAGTNLTVSSNVAVGATQIPLSGIPDAGNLKIPAIISITVTGGTVSSATVVNPGWGYVSVPEIVVEGPGGTGSPAILTAVLTGLPHQGRVSSVTITYPGSGYSSSPLIEIQVPDDYKPLDNYVWSGFEWLEVESISSNVLQLASTVVYPISSGENLLLPYQYHKQLYSNPDFFQQFYHFIHAKATNPSNEMLSYVNLGGGVESEWVLHPSRTYTYPLRNSFYFLSVPQYNDLRQDVLYQKWVYEGSDYPVTAHVYPDYSSDVLSYQSRIPFAQTTQSSFSFIDTVVSSQQRKVPQYTPVVFSYDKCRIPGKNSPVWSIKNEDSGEIEIMSDEKKFMWNFSKTGNFTVSLTIKDSNGNVASGKKNSFIVV